jgi:hypothetical protein
VSRNVAILVTGDRNAQGAHWRNVIVDYVAAMTVLPMPYVDRMGAGGGPYRNARMVDVLSNLRDVGYRTVCLAFHDDFDGSKGTKHCARRAVAAGHDTVFITSDGSFHEVTL